MPPFWVLYVCVLLLVCRRFAGYMMSTVFGVSLFFFLVCLCCSLYGVYFFGMSAFCLLVVGVFVLYVYVVGYMMCTVFSVLVFCLLCVGV